MQNGLQTFYYCNRIIGVTYFIVVRHCGLMVSVLDSRLSSLGSSPGQSTVLCSFASLHPHV